MTEQMWIVATVCLLVGALIGAGITVQWLKPKHGKDGRFVSKKHPKDDSYSTSEFD